MHAAGEASGKLGIMSAEVAMDDSNGDDSVGTLSAEPILWMQEYAFASRHTELVDVFFKKLAPHRDGSQVAEDSLLVARTKFYVFWKSTVQAKTFSDYVNQVQELMSGNLPLSRCKSLFDLKYLDTILRSQALTTLLNDENITAKEYRESLDALFPPEDLSDSLPGIIRQCVKLWRDEYFKLAQNLPKKNPDKALYERAEEIRQKRTREWFAKTFKKQLALVEVSCLGSPFLDTLASNIRAKKDPLDGVDDPLRIMQETDGSSIDDSTDVSATEVVVNSSQNKAAVVVSTDTAFGSSKQVSLAALAEAAGDDWTSIASGSHPDIHAFLNGEATAASNSASPASRPSEEESTPQGKSTPKAKSTPTAKSRAAPQATSSPEAASLDDGDRSGSETELEDDADDSDSPPPMRRSPGAVRRSLRQAKRNLDEVRSH